MSRLLLPFTSAVLLVIGCSQNAVAENSAAEQGDQASGTKAASPRADQAKPAARKSEGTPVASGEATPATCIFGEGTPTACTISSVATDDASGLTMTFHVGPDTITFRGKRQDRWWSGTLNDAPAMAYELNRGHVVFNSRNLDHYFEYWTKGNEHGNY